MDPSQAHYRSLASFMSRFGLIIGHRCCAMAAEETSDPSDSSASVDEDPELIERLEELQPSRLSAPALPALPIRPFEPGRICTEGTCNLALPDDFIDLWPNYDRHSMFLKMLFF